MELAPREPEERRGRGLETRAVTLPASLSYFIVRVPRSREVYQPHIYRQGGKNPAITSSITRACSPVWAFNH